MGTRPTRTPSNRSPFLDPGPNYTAALYESLNGRSASDNPSRNEDGGEMIVYSQGLNGPGMDTPVEQPSLRHWDGTSEENTRRTSHPQRKYSPSDLPTRGQDDAAPAMSSRPSYTQSGNSFDNRNNRGQVNIIAQSDNNHVHSPGPMAESHSSSSDGQDPRAVDRMSRTSRNSVTPPQSTSSKRKKKNSLWRFRGMFGGKKNGKGKK